VGDDVELILALGTNREVQDRFRVVGRFDRFPGMPEGVNLVIPMDRYRALTHIRPVDFLLAKASDASPAGLQRAVDAELAGPGTATPLHIETSATALAKDQSSLTAVNVRGLVQIDAVYAVGMSATAIGIFVFALLLQRRREYVTLRAQGLRTRKVRTLVVIEAAAVTVWGLLIGSIVGLAMAALAIGVLRGLFVLQPRIVLPVGSLALIVGVALVAAVASAVAASRMIGRLDPTEILREE
jgi:putative ABC transport system permease protein